MRIRFWATMRSPAFSISALMAPVRLRAVASGLLMEKVRWIAMIWSPEALMEVAGLYRRRRYTASDQVRYGGEPWSAQMSALRQFHQCDPFLKRAARFRSPSGA